MSTLKFVDTHNMVAFLEKPVEYEGFEKIIDFLSVNPSKYALTVNPTIFVSCIDQFWSTGVVKKVNGEPQVHALIDGKRIVVFEATIRRDLHLADEGGVDCLPNATIFEEITRMSAKTTAWNEFSSTMVSAIICLATNQKFNFSKLSWKGMNPTGKEINELTKMQSSTLVDETQGDVSTADLVTTASEVVTTANVVVSTTEVITDSTTTKLQNPRLEGL
ncbi:hypothetical protein Tco_0663486 [Tanacetum coccineum]